MYILKNQKGKKQYKKGGIGVYILENPHPSSGGERYQPVSYGEKMKRRKRKKRKMCRNREKNTDKGEIKVKREKNKCKRGKKEAKTGV